MLQNDSLVYIPFVLRAAFVLVQLDALQDRLDGVGVLAVLPNLPLSGGLELPAQRVALGVRVGILRKLVERQIHARIEHVGVQLKRDLVGQVAELEEEASAETVASATLSTNPIEAAEEGNGRRLGDPLRRHPPASHLIQALDGLVEERLNPAQSFFVLLDFDEVV